MSSSNMEISVRGASEQEVAQHTTVDDLKFVVADDAQTRHLVLARAGRYAYPTHAELVPPDTNFIGAGKIELEGSTYWDSDSCSKKFGYTCPADTRVAKEVLDEVKSAVQDWIQRTLKK